jgi:hypothetical protein
MAETLTGSLGGEIYSQSIFDAGATGSSLSLNYFNVHNIQYSGDTEAIILFDKPGHLGTTDAGSPPGISTPFIARLNAPGGAPIVSGTIGYQKVFDSLGNQLPGYQYVVFSGGWNISTLTGDTVLYLDYTRSNLYNFSKSGGAYIPSASGDMVFTFQQGLGGVSGTYQRNFVTRLHNTYSVTKPSGLGISGYVDKSDGGVTYNSQVFILDSNRGVIASESTVSDNSFNFTVINSSVFISLLDPIGTWYNTSLLFGTIPTPTPTPITTGGIPTGYTRTYVQNIAGTSGGAVHNSNIYIKDVENSTWSNWTNDSDGTGYIDTLPSHTIDAYGTGTGYVSASRSGLSPFDGVYELVLWNSADFPDAGTGNINLIVLVNDRTTSEAIVSASVSVTFPSGATNQYGTGAAGTAQFVVPNVSVINVRATKSGYNSANKVLTTSAFGPDTIRVELDKQTVTPVITATPFPGELTPRPTIDTRTDVEKDADIMNLIRDNGSTLVSLAIVVTIVSLIGLMRKGM